MPRVRGGGLLPHLALIAVQLLFGTWPIFGKIALRALPPTTLVAIRVLGAAIAFLLIQLLVGRAKIASKSDYARLALYSLLGVVLNQLLFVKGLSMSTVINATLLGTTIPVFTLLVSLTLGLDRPTLKRVAGILIAAAGVVYLVDPLRADFTVSTAAGNLLIVGNSLCYGAYLAISKDIVQRYGALTVITWIFLIGSIPVMPLAATSTSPAILVAAGSGVWLAVIYIILAPTVGAYYLNAWALARVDSSTVAVYIYLQPLIAFAVAPIVLHERWNSRTLVAAALIFAGVAIVTTRRRTHAMEEVVEHPEALGH